METKCEHCGKMTKVSLEGPKETPETEGPEVEVSIEGDPDSVRSILGKLIPAK